MENKRNNTSDWWKPGMILFTKVSIYIIVPIVLALYIGKYLDTKYNTTPWIFLILTFTSFLISLFVVWKNFNKYIKKLEKENKEDNISNL